MKWLAAMALLTVAATSSASTSEAYGTVVAVETLEWVSQEEPPRLKLGGRFVGIAADGTPAAAATMATVELVCPPGWKHECLAQGALLATAKEQHSCVALGWAGTSLVSGSPQAWPLRAAGLPAEQSLCLRARGLEPVAAPPPPPKALPPPKGSYGGYLLLLDAANLVTAPVYIGIVGYLVAAPSLHLSRGHYGRAAASFGMRVALPTIGVLVGALIAPPDCPREGVVCLPPGPLVGLGLGVIAAVVLDAALLGDAPAPSKAPAVGVGGGGFLLRF